jgi:hypothetical protein
MTPIIGIIASQQSGPNAQKLFLAYTTTGSSNMGNAIEGLRIDGNDYLYRTYQRSVSGGLYTGFSKYNNDGVVQWSRYGAETVSAAYEFGVAFTIDASNNVRLISAPDISGSQSIAMSLLNTDGTFSSTSYLRWNEGGNSYPRGAVADSSGNICISALSGYNGTGFGIVTSKSNSSGVLQWSRRYGSTSAWSNAGSLTTDSSSNIFVCGDTNASGAYLPLIVKYNTSGTVQSQWGFTDSGNTTTCSECVVDSSGNVYAVLSGGSSGSYTSHVVKLDSSGNITWQRKVASDTRLLSISLHSSGDVFVAGTTNSDRGFIARFDSSGSIQWQRSLTGVTSSNVGALKNNCMYINSSTVVGGYEAPHVAKLPDDGSKTGTYTVGSLTNVYAASSATESTGTLSRATISYADSAFDYGTTSYSYSNSTESLTTQRTII